MKKLLNRFGFALLLTAAISLTAFTGEQNPNSQKGQEKKQQKSQNQGKGNKGNNNPNGDQGNNNKNKKPKNNNQGNDNQDNPGNSDKDDRKDHKDDKVKNEKNKDGYKWDRENFKDRHKLKNKDKVTICHKFSRGNQEGVSIRVSRNALNAHLNHGDIMGDCPGVNSKRYSDGFLQSRADYYNYLEDGHEQILYSQSIYDYALVRLADSRTELVQYNNLPPEEIERRRLVVSELEQEVSLLEALIAGAAGVVVSKLFS